MTFENIPNHRISNQLLTASEHHSAEEIVSHFGAMQAQDFTMAKWAIGLRLDADENTIDNAINNAEIVRTHILRPTWHFVAANDIYWMLDLTAPHVKTILNSSSRRLELDEKVMLTCMKVIEKLLENNQHLTRNEIMSKIQKKKIDTTQNRSSHIMMHAELEGLVCNGIPHEKQQTYALLEKRVKRTPSLSKEEALAKLAAKYFTSHGPATLRDFIWWSGLSVANAKKALEFIRTDFISEIINGQEFWFSDSKITTSKTVHLLPSFDEFLISYKDRTASIVLEHQPKAFTNNGIFNPVILIDGKVEGSWKRTLKNDLIEIEITPFEKFSTTETKMITKAAEKYARYLNKKVMFVS